MTTTRTRDPLSTPKTSGKKIKSQEKLLLLEPLVELDLDDEEDVPLDDSPGIDGTVLGSDKSPKQKQYEKLKAQAERDLHALTSSLQATVPAVKKEIDKIQPKIDAGEKAARTGNYKKAISDINGYKKHVKLARSLELKHLEAEYSYRAQLPLFQQRLSELATLPGIEDVRTAGQERVNQANAAAERGDFVTAAAKLDSKALAGLKFDKHQKTSKEAIKSLSGASEEFREAVTNANDAIARLSVVATNAEVQPFQQELTALLDVAAKTANVKSAKKTKGKSGDRRGLIEAESTEHAALALRPVIAEMEQRIVVLEKFRLKAIGLKGNVETNLRKLTEVRASSGNVAPLNRQKQRADVLITNKEFERAAGELKKLKENTAVLLREVGDANKLWKDEGKAALEQYLREVGVLMLEPVTKPEATLLKTRLDKIQELAVTKQEVVLALSMISGISEEIGTLNTKLLTWRALDGARTTADEVVNPKKGEVDGVLATLKLAVKSKGGTGDDLGTYTADLKAIVAEWAALKEVADTAPKLTESRDKIVKKLTELKLAVETSTTTDGGPAKLADMEKQSAYEQERKLMEALLKEMRALGGPRVDDLVRRATAIHQAAGNGYAKAIGDSEALRREGTLLKNALELEGANYKPLIGDNDLTAKQTELRQDVATVLKALKKRKNKDLKMFEAFFTGLDEELQDLTAVLTSTSLPTLKSAEQSLKDIRKRLDEAKAGILKSDPSGRSSGAYRELEDEDTPVDLDGPSFADVVTKINETAALFEDADLKKATPNALLGLKAEFEELKTTVGSLGAAEGIAALDKFVKESVEPAVEKAGDIAFDLGNFNREHVAFSSKVSNLKKTQGTHLAKYIAELEGQLKSLKASTSDETKVSQAAADLEKLHEEFTTAADEGTLTAKEHEAAAAEEKLKQERKVWKTQYAAFKNNDLKRVTLALKQAKAKRVTVDEGQLTTLKKMGEGANDLAKQDNFDAAREALKAAREHAATVALSPAGLAVTSRGKLEPCVKQWRNAVTLFNDSLAEIRGQLAAPEEGETEGVKTAAAKVVKHLDALLTTFDRNAFDRSVNVLKNPSVAEDAPAKRAARESALRLVRQYMALVRKDPLIKKMLRPTPFGAVKHNPLYAALNNLDANIQRCCS